MINYIQIQDDLKNLSDEQVQGVATNPANPMYSTLAIGELERRKRVRTDFEARKANPMSTIAQQLTMPGGAFPQPQPGMAEQPMQSPAAPTPAVGMPMERGGDVTDSVRQYQSLLRIPGLETIEGARDTARGLMGEDPSVGLRGMIDMYRGGAKRRRNDDMTLLLARMGAGLMNSRRPDFLGALGEGASAGVEGLSALQQRRNEEERLGIADESVLSRLAAERQGQELSAMSDLFETGRGGLEQAADLEGNLINRDTQLDVARIYASRAGGGSGGSNSSTIEARALYTRAGTNLNAARNRLMQLQRNGFSSGPEFDAAQRDVARWEQEYADARDRLVRAIEGEVMEADAPMVDPRADLEIGGLDATNAPNIRQAPRQDMYGGLNTIGGRVAQTARVMQMARENGWNREQTRAAIREIWGDQAVEPTGVDEYIQGQRSRAREDLGDYAVRTE